MAGSLLNREDLLGICIPQTPQIASFQALDRLDVLGNLPGFACDLYCNANETYIFLARTGSIKDEDFTKDGDADGNTRVNMPGIYIYNWLSEVSVLRKMETQLFGELAITRAIDQRVSGMILQSTPFAGIEISGNHHPASTNQQFHTN